MSDKARFWDKHAEKYALRPVAGQEAYEKKLEITRSYFPLVKVFTQTQLTEKPSASHALFTYRFETSDSRHQSSRIIPQQDRVDAPLQRPVDTRSAV